jgi:DMSO/TMAO reductase YedYZ molybdopterin-dependent catalytic subunit
MRPVPESSSFPPVQTRREAIRTMGLAAVGLAVTPVPGFPLSWFRAQEMVVPFTDVPDTFTGRRGGTETYPGQNLSAQDLRNLTEWVTPIEDYFVVSHYPIPEIAQASYSLQVTGLVDRPVTLTLAQLHARPRVERTTVFECGGNARGLFHGMVGNATWTGTELRPLLDEAGPTSLAREAHFWGTDVGTEEIRGNEYEQNFARSMSLEQILEANPILAYEMNGEPLPIVHGFPVRLIVPGWYGVAQVKWLQRIDLSTDRLMTRFMARDYVTLMGREVDGQTEWVETSVTRQRVKSAIARVTRAGDQFTIFGVAYGDGTPLRSVEVRVDDGSWISAELDRPGDPFTWTFFTARTTGIANGEHTVVSRATDTLGRTQPENLELKRTRWENNELFVRMIAVS